MTTAEHLAAQATSSPEAQLPQTGSLENEAAALSGAPDPAWIAQLANAFYNDHPGQTVPSGGASQPSPSLSDADPHVSSNRASPMFDAPLSPSEASSAPFLVPNPSGGASQPSAPIYAYEALRPGAYSPPTSPSGGAVPSTPVHAIETGRPTAYLPPSSPSGASAPSGPVQGYDALHAESYLPPSSPSGAAAPSSPVHAYEPSGTNQSAATGFTYAPFWPLTPGPSAGGADPWQADLEPSFHPTSAQPSPAADPRPAPTGGPQYTGASHPYGGLPGPDLSARSAHGSGAPHFASGGTHPFGTAPGPNTAPPHHSLETAGDAPDHGAHPFGTAPGPNTAVPAPSALDADDPHHPHNGRSWSGGVPNQSDVAGTQTHSGGVVSAVPLFDQDRTTFGRPQGGAPAGDSYYFLDQWRSPEHADAASQPLPRSERRNGTTGNIPTPPISGRRAFIPEVFRRDFPILDQEVNGRPLIWLDNAATTQKPRAVIDRIAHFYTHENSNVHRAAHTLAARSTEAFEQAREKVRRFINAPSVKNIIFVRGTTEGINLVSQAWGRRNVGPGDEVVITHLEHHSNIVPWQLLCAEKGAVLRVAPVDDHGDVILDQYEKLLNPRTRIVSFTQVSNALGTVTPVREMVAMAHRHGARVVVDGAQSICHMPVDVQALDADFFVFSGHKMFGPTGIGVVYGKSDELEVMPPWQGGGSMIDDVTFEKTTYMPPPERFEAGTSNIADAVGLGAAIDYLETIGMSNIAAYEHELLGYAIEKLLGVPGVKIVGRPKERAGAISFLLGDRPTQKVGKALDMEGIAVRAGHHCAQPILRRFGVESTIRPSFALYNTTDDVDALIEALFRIAQRGVSVL
jgi:cysteine desulfurase/selenocysteine lyase